MIAAKHKGYVATAYGSRGLIIRDKHGREVLHTSSWNRDMEKPVDEALVDAIENYLVLQSRIE